MTDQKPWYHQVKWRKVSLGGVSTVLCDEQPRNDTAIPPYSYDASKGYCVAYPFRHERALSEGGGFEIRLDFVSFGHREAQLIASAPETARERDEAVDLLQLFAQQTAFAEAAGMDRIRLRIPVSDMQRVNDFLARTLSRAKP